MKITVLHDNGGNIISAFIPLSEIPQTQGSRYGTGGVIAGVDQQVSEIEVPTEHAELIQNGEFAKLKIAIQGTQNTLVRK
jgi:hypothetical protein